PELPGLGTPWGSAVTIDYKRRCGDRVSVVREEGCEADVRVRAWLELHDVRVQRSEGERRRDGDCELRREECRQACRRGRTAALSDRRRGREAHAPARIRARHARAR